MKEKTKENLISVSKAILLSVGILGFVAVAVVAGNAVQLLKHTPLGGKRQKLKIYEINKNIKLLINRGLVIEKEDEDCKYLEITPKGRNLLLKYELEGLSKEKPKMWDHKYRVVIFDISEHKKKTRDHLRKILVNFGFVCMQDSVWVYPYHCQEIVELLKKYLELNEEVIYMTVDSIENDKWLRDKFKLK